MHVQYMVFSGYVVTVLQALYQCMMMHGLVVVPTLVIYRRAAQRPPCSIYISL